ncbi:hypothetical protein NIES4071_04020 [Calothrix sp. NIES-4071]|nr:hypothetical protein NIES4071_04020 [Calothrix sp. NIES-4071]BAZ54748.1 hypothetical protein NIES4105_04010 [Calothrix sp. NIES-4105]
MFANGVPVLRLLLSCTVSYISDENVTYNSTMPILDPNQSYTFSRYFELGFEASELLPSRSKNTE